METGYKKFQTTQHNKTKQNKKKIQTVGFKFIDVKDFVYLFFKKDLASSIS